VSRNEVACTTQYSGIVYPQLKETYIAVSPAPGKSATKEHYTRVQWGEVWGAK
jgi:hypothetical protein